MNTTNNKQSNITSINQSVSNIFNTLARFLVETGIIFPSVIIKFPPSVFTNSWIILVYTKCP